MESVTGMPLSSSAWSLFKLSWSF